MRASGRYLLMLTVICMISWGWFVSHYLILIGGVTPSLPDLVYLVKKGALPSVAGQYIAFTPPENPYYTQTFIKIVGGVEGDKVSKDPHNNFYINGQLIGKAKSFSRTNEQLYPGPTGSIPKGNYFVYTTHKDSYDSRYRQIGWISENRVIGTAIPIL